MLYVRSTMPADLLFLSAKIRIILETRKFIKYNFRSLTFICRYNSAMLNLIKILSELYFNSRIMTIFAA